VKLVGHLVPGQQDMAAWSAQRVGGDHIALAVTMKIGNEREAAAAIRDQGPPRSLLESLDAYGIPRDVRAKLVDWLTADGLSVADQSPLIIWLEGTFAAAAQTFGLQFVFRQEGDLRLYRPTQEPSVPDWAAPWIAGIVGLENVIRLSPRLRKPTRADDLANDGQGFFPSDLQTAYQFPSQFDGTGQTIGLLEFSNGYNPADIQGFWSAMGIAAPTVVFVSVDGTPNDGGVSSVDMECTLDLEWAGAMAPGSTLVVYEASAGTSDQSFGLSVLKALNAAAHDATHHPSVLSISYGDAEDRFPAAELCAWDSVMAEAGLLGITPFVASGDEGAYGIRGPGRPVRHVDAPASCPHAVAVGGTTLILNPNGSIQSETGWTDTNDNGASGGGISQVFAVPSYQSGLTLPIPKGSKPGRGVPDVSANANPDTGYAIMFQGVMTVVGGTSAASPLWASLWARLNQARAEAHQTAMGASHKALYDLGPTSAFRDITRGNNNYDGVVGYECTPGWDAVTGWGSPVGATLIAELS
jgi:kumamolisin